MSTGFNLGTKNAHAAAADKNKNLKLISCRPFLNDDLTPLREDVEIFINDFCTSCVISFDYENKNYNNANITRLAKDAGIFDVKFISEHEAMNAYFDFNFNKLNKFLVVDAGASAARLNILERENNKNKSEDENNYKILERAVVESVSGDSFDAAIFDWLKNLRADLDFNLSEAERVKIALSNFEELKWENIIIYRFDIERLIKFQIRELAHTVKRMALMHKPEKIFFTGGTCKIPVLRDILIELVSPLVTSLGALNATVCVNAVRPKGSGEVKDFLIFNEDDITALGTAIYALKAENAAHELENNKNPAHDHNERAKNIDKIRELELSLIEIEDVLNRTQKDRLHLIFKRAKDASYPSDLIKLYDGLVNELHQAAANY